MKIASLIPGHPYQLRAQLREEVVEYVGPEARGPKVVVRNRRNVELSVMPGSLHPLPAA